MKSETGGQANFVAQAADSIGEKALALLKIASEQQPVSGSEQFFWRLGDRRVGDLAGRLRRRQSRTAKTQQEGRYEEEIADDHTREALCLGVVPNASRGGWPQCGESRVPSSLHLSSGGWRPGEH